MRDASIYLANLAVGAAFHLAAWEIGRRLLPRVCGKRIAAAERGEAALFAAVLGFAVFGAVAFALGAAQLLLRPVLAACLLVPAASGAVSLVRERPWRGARPSFDGLGVVVALAIVAAMLPRALTPILLHDDNAYHLAIPAAYLAEGGFHYIPMLNANMPHLVETLYLFPLSLGDFTAPKVLNLLFHVWTVLGLASYLRGRVGRATAGVACLLYASSPIGIWHMGTGYVEPGIATFLLAGIVAFLRWLEGRDAGHLTLLGIACGAAAASKYTGWIYALAILGVAAIAIARSGGSPTSRAALALRPLAGFAAIVAPWVVKNLALTGNPLYPMLHGVFGGRDLSDALVLHLSRHFGSVGDPKSLVDTLLLPYRLALDPERYFRMPFPAVLLALAVLALFLPRSWRDPSRYVVGIAVVGFAGWAASCQYGRLLVAWTPALLLAAMIPLERFAGRRKAAAALGAVVVLAAGVQLWRTPLLPPHGVPHTAIFTQPRERILEANFNYRLCRFLERDVPPGGKVLAFWENRFFFYDGKVVVDIVHEASSSLDRLRRHDDPAAFAESLRAEGFTHVVIDRYPYERYFDEELDFSLVHERLYPRSRLDRDRELFERFVSTELTPVYTEDDRIVCRLGVRSQNGRFR